MTSTALPHPHIPFPSQDGKPGLVSASLPRRAGPGNIFGLAGQLKQQIRIGEMGRRNPHIVGKVYEMGNKNRAAVAAAVRGSGICRGGFHSHRLNEEATKCLSTIMATKREHCPELFRGTAK